MRKATVRHIAPRRRGTGRGQNVQRREINLRVAIMNAFDKVGGEDYLLYVARKEPKTFIALLAKLLPTKVEGDEMVRDAVVQVLTGVPRNPTDPTTQGPPVIDVEDGDKPPGAEDSVH